MYDVFERFNRGLQEVRRNEPVREKFKRAPWGWIGFGAALSAIAGMFLFSKPEQLKQFRDFIKRKVA